MYIYMYTYIHTYIHIYIYLYIYIYFLWERSGGVTGVLMGEVESYGSATELHLPESYGTRIIMES